MNAQLKGSVLVVDDEPHIRKIVSLALSSLGITVFESPSGEAALEVVKEESIDVVISDLQMPGMNGDQLIVQLKEEQPHIQSIVITAYGDMETVVKVMRAGASDFIAKPFENSELRTIVTKLLKGRTLQADTINTLPVGKVVSGVIGESASFKESLALALKAARADSSVLILGESGTGKEVIAKTIHAESTRSSGPFVAVNCGAIPENLIESELFGYMKGAFTGAQHDKPGKFEMANGGTVFLDEIGEMPLVMQVKLLRVIQERMIDRVGGFTSIPVDFRIIGATHRNLEKEVAEGRFREDLYYRLNVVPILLPPLSRRGDDVFLLANHFLTAFNKRYSMGYSLTSENRETLMRYPWPGNIRELENVLERAVVLGDGKQLTFSIGEKGASTPQPTMKLEQKEVERKSIVSALDACRWNKTKTAEYLGISRRSLLYKVKAFEIS
ncbi:MAG: sigma-54 dependent transcriptional regulator [Fibrobacterales bacterium]